MDPRVFRANGKVQLWSSNEWNPLALYKGAIKVMGELIIQTFEVRLHFQYGTAVGCFGFGAFLLLQMEIEFGFRDVKLKQTVSQVRLVEYRSAFSFDGHWNAMQSVADFSG